MRRTATATSHGQTPAGLFLALALIVGGFACAGFTATMAPQSKQGFLKDGLPKAAFDLNCDQEKLEVTQLGDSAMGVRGCGKSGRYQYVLNVGWVLNSAAN